MDTGEDSRTRYGNGCYFTRRGPRRLVARTAADSLRRTISTCITPSARTASTLVAARTAHSWPSEGQTANHSPCSSLNQTVTANRFRMSSSLCLPKIRMTVAGETGPGSTGNDPHEPRAPTTMIRLPPDIRFEKRAMGEDRWAYNFRHDQLGDIGRILLVPNPNGGEGTFVSVEVAGDPDDPMTEERRAIFEPIGNEISNQMAAKTGTMPGPTPVPTKPLVHEDQHCVESKLMQCPKCDGFVAMLVYAHGATDTARLQDYARLMYPEYARRELPTWIIGPRGSVASPSAGRHDEGVADARTNRAPGPLTSSTPRRANSPHATADNPFQARRQT